VEELCVCAAERDLMYRRWQGNRSRPYGGQRPPAEAGNRLNRTCWRLNNASPSCGINCWCATPTMRATRLVAGAGRAVPALPGRRDGVDRVLHRPRCAAGIRGHPPGHRRCIACRSISQQSRASTGCCASTWTRPRAAHERLPALTANAQALLHRLYQGLIEPLEEALRAYQRWIVVPFGPLHYLPFQALYDGSQYLVEQHEISYLPGASLLRFCLEPRQRSRGRRCLRPFPTRTAAQHAARSGVPSSRSSAAICFWRARPRRRAFGRLRAAARYCIWPPTATSGLTTRSSPDWRWPMAG
jgi:hypothetical protein